MALRGQSFNVYMHIMTAESAAMKEPAAGYGVTPLEQARTIDGLSLMRGIMEGRFPAPPKLG